MTSFYHIIFLSYSKRYSLVISYSYDISHLKKNSSDIILNRKLQHTPITFTNASCEKDLFCVCFPNFYMVIDNRPFFLL